MAYFIYFRNKSGKLCSTIHSKPLTEINIPTGNMDEDGDTMEYKLVPCKFINLKNRKKST